VTNRVKTQLYNKEAHNYSQTYVIFRIWYAFQFC